MNEIFKRTELIIGEKALLNLSSKTVAVFGIGGVGSYIVEALARGGIGHLVLCDNDRVAKSNINRQLIALHSTIGENKVDVAKMRVLDINPKAKVTVYNEFFSEETAGKFSFENVDYIVDAIDTVTSKLLLITLAKELNIPIISSMGTGNKLDPGKLQLADISETSVCPLARVMRYELKKRNINNVNVVFSTETPIKPKKDESENSKRRQIPGSSSFVPPCAGLLIASKVIRDFIDNSY